MDFEDIVYEKTGGVAYVTINRPEVLNAFRDVTLREMNEALSDAWGDDGLGVGDRVSQLHYLVRNIPKPVIAAVRGYAVGGGNILHFICDLTIASEDSVFGQVGPKVGSVDPGFGTAYLARLVGEKKAREMWYLCRKYTAREALEMGLVNRVVPPEDLDSEVAAWCREILSMSPTAVKLAKYSFNCATDGLFGASSMGRASLGLLGETAEGREGTDAFLEKRPPDFRSRAK